MDNINQAIAKDMLIDVDNSIFSDEFGEQICLLADLPSDGELIEQIEMEE